MRRHRQRPGAPALRAPRGHKIGKAIGTSPSPRKSGWRHHPPLQFHAQPSRHTKGKQTPVAIVTYCPRISHLITASPSATRRRLFHPELKFYPLHSKSFFVHISLRAASSPSKYTHTNTCMTVKNLIIMQRNPMRLTDCPNTMAQEHKASVGGSAGCTAMDRPVRLPQMCAFYHPQSVFLHCKCPHGTAHTHKKTPKLKNLNCTVWATTYRQSVLNPRNSGFVITAVLGYHFFNYVVSHIIWKVLSHLRSRGLRCVYSTTSCGKFYSLYFQWRE